MVKDGEKTTISTSNGFHLAGIVPIDIQTNSFDMPWHDCYMPINRNYLAVERAIYECATVGCETIWVVYKKGISPLLRHRVGDFVYDPVYSRNSLRNVPGDPRKSFRKVPVFYTPLNPEDYNIRGGLPWSIIYGYKTIYNITTSVSRWIAPSKYYVAFPYGVYSLTQLKGMRKKISSTDSIFLKDPLGRTAKDGEYLGFTFDVDDYKIYRQSFMEKEKENWNSAKDSKNLVDNKFVTMQEFLKNASVKNILDISWYHNISNWEGYERFISVKENWVKKPSFIQQYGEFGPLCNDEI